MRFAIHQSADVPTSYLLTMARDDFSAVPADILAELGRIKYLRMSRSKTSETPIIARMYPSIRQHLVEHGFYVLSWSDREG